MMDMASLYLTQLYLPDLEIKIEPDDFAELILGPEDSISEPEELTSSFGSEEDFKIEQDSMTQSLLEDSDTTDSLTLVANLDKIKKEFSPLSPQSDSSDDTSSKKKKIRKPRPPNQYCNICNKTFAKTTNMQRHMVTHSKIKAFNCSQCKKSFTQKSSLIAHSNIHHSTSNNRCPDCTVPFASLKKLISHMLNVHGKDLVFICQLCNRKFSRKCNLQCHVEKDHIISPDTINCNFTLIPSKNSPIVQETKNNIPVFPYLKCDPLQIKTITPLAKCLNVEDTVANSTQNFVPIKPLLKKTFDVKHVLPNTNIGECAYPMPLDIGENQI